MATRKAIPPPLLVGPACPECGTRMVLARIFLDRPGPDQRTYECPRCEQEITEPVQLKKAS